MADLEKALCIIKPDAIRRGVDHVILHKLLEHWSMKTGGRAFNINNLARKIVSRPALRELYQQHREKEFFEPLVEFMNSGEIYLIELEGDNCCAELRRFVEKTRAVLATSTRENVIHGSDSPEAGRREAGLFF